jgi:hypothetical protein
VSDYGKNFGFRRSEPAVREGRLKVPASGTYLQGELVTYNPAKPGELTHAAAGAAVQAGFTGLLIQEEGWDVSAFGPPVVDSNSKGKALNAKPGVITTGAGLKVWLRNTATDTHFDGRVIPAVTRVDLTGVTAIGDELQWDGAKYVKKSTGAAVLKVTAIDVAGGYVEAVLVG